MAQATGRRVLPFVYLVHVTVLCGLLAAVGYVLDRLPLLPASVSRRYQGVMFAAMFGLSRPVDGWMDPSTEPLAGSVATDSTP